MAVGTSLLECAVAALCVLLVHGQITGCPAGQEYDEGTTNCQACAQGKYSGTTNRDACIRSATGRPAVLLVATVGPTVGPTGPTNSWTNWSNGMTLTPASAVHNAAVRCTPAR